jgi:hypothetical protein
MARACRGNAPILLVREFIVGALGFVRAVFMNPSDPKSFWTREIRLGALTVLVSRLLTAQVLAIYDDAFITMRYARNLAEGFGFVYNPGERVMGDTCPAFGLLQSIFFFLHLPMPALLVALNVVLDATIFVVSAKLLTDANRARAIVPFAFVMAIDPILARICVGGMEMNLHLLVVLAAVLSHHANRPYRATLLASLAYFLRPESVLLVGLLCALELKRNGWKRAVACAALSLAVVAGPLLWMYSYYGTIIAQSVIAKSTWSSPTYAQLLRELVFNDPLQVVLVPAMLIALYGLRRDDGPLRTLGSLASLTTIAYMAYRPKVFPWYGELIHYCVALLGTLGLLDLGKRIAPALYVKFAGPRVAMASSAAAIAVWVAVVLSSGGESPVGKRVYGSMEAWFRAHDASSKTVLASDIGAIGYYSRSRVFDSDGLVWPRAVEYRSQRNAPPDVMLRILHDFKPSLVMVIATDPSLQPVLTDSMIQRDYDIATTFAKHAIDFSALPEDWVQAYVLLERKPSSAY